MTKGGSDLGQSCLDELFEPFAPAGSEDEAKGFQQSTNLVRKRRARGNQLGAHAEQDTERMALQTFHFHGPIPPHPGLAARGLPHHCDRFC